MSQTNNSVFSNAIISSSHRRLLYILGGLYLAQGIPTYLLMVALPPIMRESGSSRTAIGLFSLLMVPMTIRFLVAPLVDRWSPLPKLGHRRGWVVPCQILVSVGIASMALLDPGNAPVLFAICVSIMIVSSIQDIATDGYAVRHLDDRIRSLGNAVQAGAVALGVIIGGTAALVIFQKAGWQTTILLVAALSLLPLFAALAMQREVPVAGKHYEKACLMAFFRRPNAWLILSFALSYRASEGLVRGMEGTYLVDIKVPADWIGYLYGGAASTAGLVGVAIAAFMIRKAGLPTTLILLGALRSICFLAFSLNAFGIIPGQWVAMSASAFQTLIRYMELVAIYTFFMKFSSNNQPGTDFTILSCAELIVYMAGASVAGLIADRLGYFILFSSATVLSLAGMGLSVWFLQKIAHGSGTPVGRA